MPFCKKCGLEYSEGDTYCNKCGTNLPGGELTSPAEKGESKLESGPTPEKVPVRVKGKKITIVVIIFGFFLIGALGVGYYVYSQEQQQLQLQGQLISYKNLTENELAKLYAIGNKYPIRTTYGVPTQCTLGQKDQIDVYYIAVYTQCLEDYSTQTSLTKQHLTDYRDFIAKNEVSLQAMGINTLQIKSTIDNQSVTIDKGIREMQTKLQDMKEEARLKEQQRLQEQQRLEQQRLQEQQRSKELKALNDQFNSYVEVINSDVAKINALSKKYPAQMSNSVYIRYVDEYSIQAGVYRQHLIEFRDFITKNEASLQALGITPIQRKGAIDNELSNIDKNARDMQRNLQNMRESQEQTMNLLKLLATLFL